MDSPGGSLAKASRRSASNLSRGSAAPVKPLPPSVSAASDVSAVSPDHSESAVLMSSPDSPLLLSPLSPSGSRAPSEIGSSPPDRETVLHPDASLLSLELSSHSLGVSGGNSPNSVVEGSTRSGETSRKRSDSLDRGARSPRAQDGNDRRMSRRRRGGAERKKHSSSVSSPKSGGEQDQKKESRSGSRKEVRMGGKLYWPRASVTYGEGGPWEFATEEERAKKKENEARKAGTFVPTEKFVEGRIDSTSPARPRLKEMENLRNDALPPRKLTSADWEAAKKKKGHKHEHLLKDGDGKPAANIQFTRRGDSFHRPAVVLPGETVVDHMRIPWIASSGRLGLLALEKGEREEAPADSTVFEKTLQGMPSDPLSRMDNAPLESTLLERGAVDAQKERSRRTLGIKEENAAKELTDILIADYDYEKPPKEGPRSETDEDADAAVRRDKDQHFTLRQNPAVPFPYSQRQEEWDITSLSRISTTAEKVYHVLNDPVPFEGFSFSRQPTLTEGNVDMFYNLDSKETQEQFRVTDQIKSSHERVRFAAQVVSNLMDEPKTDKRTRWLNLRRVDKLYAGVPVSSREVPSSTEGHLERPLRKRNGELRAVGEESDDEMTLMAVESPPPPVDSPQLPHPYQRRDWGPRKPKKMTLNLYAEIRYLHQCERVIEAIKESLGPSWSRRLPRAGVLALLLRHPLPIPLSENLARSGAELMQRLHRGRFWVEIYHSIWFPLSLERFQLFCTNGSGACCLGWESTTRACDWFYYTRNLPKMFRLSNYLLTGALESHVPGLQRLLFRLNALNFFAYRISWSLHYSFYGNKSFTPPKKSMLLGRDGVTLDPVQMSNLASTLLRCLLGHSTACSAMCYNVEAVGRLWPFVIEYKSNFITKEELCLRIFTCPLTNAFFSVLAKGEVPEMPQAVHAVHSYFVLLTEFLYGGRPKGFFESLSRSFETPVPCIWTQLAGALNEPSNQNIFLIGDILLFVTDLFYLTCLDGAALPRRAARHIHKRITAKILPFLEEGRPDLADPDTWSQIDRNARSLRTALFTAMHDAAIGPELLEPFTLPVRSAPETDPKTYKLAWPSLARLFPLPDELPCWRPGCKKTLRLTADKVTAPEASNFRYCQQCNIAAYCSLACQRQHWLLEHHQVCCYFRRPPTFLRFQMLPGQVPMELEYPVFDIFKGMFDIDWFDDGAAFEPIF
ncbi:MYND finger domain-containing protein [Toxoplasma gondii ME49]|uniref:MYND finger domain-containing protein n=1 Tax=Toxoplasma gondii (strain ATCC 50611 / Me49) TaxID=508771 RepID=S8GGU2_TOXGM|nr:MYND finger domain-containing protein [Toxoplasma gondii ME49]EPT31075.1 MYND finger domain-containing protein [Toxoplasma gondii ME49]|eukprot:XP_018637806.1 MYND finger domain-containing protein [Toxoplasma gondii ME49]